MLIFFSLVIIVKGLSVSLSGVEATKFIELIIIIIIFFWGGEWLRNYGQNLDNGG